MFRSYAAVPDSEAKAPEPRTVFVAEHNRIVSRGTDPAERPAAVSTPRGDPDHQA